jgi:hypothetical protein
MLPGKIYVTVVPPGVNPFAGPHYTLGRSEYEKSFAGYVKPDGTFTKGAIASTEGAEAKPFGTAREAIAWAEARGWIVINKSTF